MTEIMKSNGNIKKDAGKAIDPFARLKAQIGGMKNGKAGGLVMSGELYFVLDDSGSMANSCSDKEGRVMSKSQAVEAVINELQTTYAGKVKINLIAFGNTAGVINSMDSYNNHRFGYSTNIAEGLTYLTEPNSIAILLSDGDECIGHAMDQVPSLKDKTITVHCIGVGIESDGEKLLRSIADGTGGVYAGIDADLAQIFQTFRAITSKAVAALTAGQGVIAAGA